MGLAMHLMTLNERRSMLGCSGTSSLPALRTSLNLADQISPVGDAISSLNAMAAEQVTCMHGFVLDVRAVYQHS